MDYRTETFTTLRFAMYQNNGRQDEKRTWHAKSQLSSESIFMLSTANQQVIDSSSMSYVTTFKRREHLKRDRPWHGFVLLRRSRLLTYCRIRIDKSSLIVHLQIPQIWPMTPSVTHLIHHLSITHLTTFSNRKLSIKSFKV